MIFTVETAVTATGTAGFIIESTSRGRGAEPPKEVNIIAFTKAEAEAVISQLLKQMQAEQETPAR